MLVRRLCLSLIAPLLVLAGCGGGNQVGEPGVAGGSTVTRQISGNWTGTLHQQGMAPFQVAVDIGSTGMAEVAYTGIECGGGWTLDRVRSSPPRFTYIFTERITAGAGGSCKGSGTVSLVPITRQVPNEPAYSRMNYTFTGGGVTSRGLLHRTDPPHMNAVFRAAGVKSP